MSDLFPLCAKARLKIWTSTSTIPYIEAAIVEKVLFDERMKRRRLRDNFRKILNRLEKLLDEDV